LGGAARYDKDLFGEKRRADTFPAPLREVMVMPKFRCKCGHVIDLTESPSPHEFALIPEAALEAAGIYVENGGADWDGLFEILDKDVRHVYECPQCGELWVATGPNSFQAYVKDVTREAE
jgi:rubrerythrin